MAADCTWEEQTMPSRTHNIFASDCFGSVGSIVYAKWVVKLRDMYEVILSPFMRAYQHDVFSDLRTRMYTAMRMHARICSNYC